MHIHKNVDLNAETSHRHDGARHFILKISIKSTIIVIYARFPSMGAMCIFSFNISFFFRFINMNIAFVAYTPA